MQGTAGLGRERAGFYVLRRWEAEGEDEKHCINHVLYAKF